MVRFKVWHQYRDYQLISHQPSFYKAQRQNCFSPFVDTLVHPLLYTQVFKQFSRLFIC